MALITISSFTLPADNLTDGDYVLRLWYNQGFLDSSGQFVAPGTATSGTQLRFGATASGGVLTFNALSIYSTLDANTPYPQSIQINSQLFKGNTALPIFPFNQSACPPSWIVPDDLGGSISFETWTIANQRIYLTNPPQTFYTASQVDALIRSVAYAPASTTSLGLVEVSTTPSNPLIPVAVETTDPRVPTQSENDALVGTFGTPSSTNKYVTNSDPRVSEAVNVALLATGGSGTSGDPYTGWDTAIGTFASNITYLFNAGKYFAYSTPIVILNTTNTHLNAVGGGPAFLKFTGTGKALTFKSTALGGHYYSGAENLVIGGTASATDGFYTEACHHMRVVNISVRDVSEKAFHFKWAVANYYNTLQCSQIGNPMTTVPVNGIYTEARGGFETVQACTFVNTIVEVVSGDGIVLNDAWQNHFIGGTSESNGGRGVYLPSTARANIFTTMDNEANGASDWDVVGNFNRLEGVLSGGLIAIRSGSKKTVVRGGQINSLTIEAGAIYPYLENINYNVSGTGVLTLSEPTTTLWGIFTDIGSGGSGGGSIIPTNPVILAASTGGVSWDTTNFNVLEIGRGAAIIAQKASAGVNIPVNAYFDGANWRYRANGEASNLYQQTGEIFFQTAGAGVAGNVITWTSSGKFGSDGKLYVNDAGTLKAVTYGANDSGGAGFKLLRIAN